MHTLPHLPVPPRACRHPGPPTITSVSLGLQNAVDVVVHSPANDGGSVVISYRVVGVPTGGGANITVSGFGRDVAGSKVSGRGRWGAELECHSPACPVAARSAGDVRVLALARACKGALMQLPKCRPIWAWLSFIPPAEAAEHPKWQL